MDLAIRIDDTWMDYFPPGAEIPGDRLEHLQGYKYRDDVAFEHHPRLRRAVLRMRLPKSEWQQFGALRFPDDVDLEAVDRDITDGLDPGDAADRALFTQLRDFQCLECLAPYLLLIVEAAIPGTSIVRRRNHPSGYRCPGCGDDRFHDHVEVMGW